MKFLLIIAKVYYMHKLINLHLFICFIFQYIYYYNKFFFIVNNSQNEIVNKPQTEILQ